MWWWTARTDRLLLAEYGETMEPLDTSQDYAPAEELVNSLYGFKDFPGNLDDLRACMYGISKSDIRYLPLTQDAFKLHVQCAVNQILRWKTAHLSNVVYLSPTLFGRHMTTNGLASTLDTKSTKPAIPTKINFCKCKKDSAWRTVYVVM